MDIETALAQQFWQYDRYSIEFSNTQYDRDIIGFMTIKSVLGTTFGLLLDNLQLNHVDS